MRHTERMVVVLSSFVACAAAQGQIFGARERDPFLPSAPSGKVLAIDADGDGRVDLIVGEGSLVFYRNEGPGKFVRQATSPGFLNGEEVVGDFDGDGDLDFVGADAYRNVGGGQFVREPTGFLTFTRPALFDFDGDGDLDLATFALLIPGGFHLLTNDGAGHFTEVTAAALPATTDPNSLSSFVAFDAERDGDIDLVAGRGTFLLEVVLLRNDGQGAFVEESIPVPPLFGFAANILAGDLDGDGNIDLAIGGLVPQPDLYLNDGTGAFQLVPSSGLQSVPLFSTFVAWADWDQDGRADLVSFHGIWRNLGNFHFGLTPWPLRGTGTDVHVVDIDGDLDLDYVASGSPVIVTLNTSEGAMLSTTTAVTVGIAMERVFGNIARPEGGLLVQGSSALSNYAVTQGMPWQRNRVLVPQFLPFEAPVTDAAPTRPWGAPVVCDANGATLHSPLNSAPLPGSATATHVGAGDLLGSSDDEIVLGAPTINGPEILVGEPYPGYVLQPLLSLAPATPSNAPVAEAVVIADMDGDGRNDIVHELRVLHNDGDGAFSQVADFALLVAPTSTNLIAIDFDGDGDQDLVVWGGTSPTLLLRNDGDHFADATFGHIPAPDIAPAQLVSKGDVDGDGDDDLLVARFNRSNLLRNDQGVFTRVANVAPVGMLVDIDDDGRADVFTGQAVLYSLFANLRAPRLALPGTDWLLQVSTWRQGSVPYLALVAVGTRWLAWPVEIPGLGTFFVDMATADVFPVALTAGQGERVLQIPNTPLVLGVNLVAQAAIFDTQSVVLTGPVFDAVR